MSISTLKKLLDNAIRKLSLLCDRVGNGWGCSNYMKTVWNSEDTSSILIYKLSSS